jgi:hypothetical protein
VHFELPKTLTPNESIKDIIIKTIKEQQPQTTSQLIAFIQKTTNLSEKEIINILNQLEAEDKIHFNIRPDLPSFSFQTYLFSSESTWYWSIIALALVTTLTVFAVPQDSYPFAYVRNFLGVIFVLFLPGYAFVKAFFQKKVPFKTTSESFDTIERLVLSLGVSIAIVPIVGLILYYTPLGTDLTPITLCLLAFTLVLATVAMFREYQSKSIIVQQAY